MQTIQQPNPTAPCLALHQFLRQEIGERSPALVAAVQGVAVGSIEIAQAVERASLMALLGQTGNTNVQGEEVQKLDEYADKIFSRALAQTNQFYLMLSEERDEVFQEGVVRDDAPFVIAFDPVDGSSNIDVNVSIGTIWGIYPRSKAAEGHSAQFFQGGDKQVAAGYVMYGASTIMVLTVGQGVYGFTLDREKGEYLLTHPNLTLKEGGKIYSCNEANQNQWSPGVRAFVTRAKECKDGKVMFSQRYVGSLVADFHRSLLKGGVFFYPADVKNTRGKLRLLYECAPLAFLATQAGGAASDGETPILNLVPTEVHQRVPLFIGSSSLVRDLEQDIRALG